MDVLTAHQLFRTEAVLHPSRRRRPGHPLRVRPSEQAGGDLQQRRRFVREGGPLLARIGRPQLDVRGHRHGPVQDAVLDHGRETDERTGQWRKWRRPVKTMARWWRSATSMAISSRIEPPGWMIAETPAWAAIWIPSGKGK